MEGNNLNSGVLQTQAVDSSTPNEPSDDERSECIVCDDSLDYSTCDDGVVGCFCGMYKSEDEVDEGDRDYKQCGE